MQSHKSSIQIWLMLCCLAMALAGCGFFAEPVVQPLPSVTPALPTQPLDDPQEPSPSPEPPPTNQTITITSPPPRTLVGSPVTISGQTALLPTGRSLNYVLRDAAGSILGQGSFPAIPSDDGGAHFTASLTFNLPPSGGTIGLELFEPGSSGAPPLASSRLDLVVAPPQSIMLDTPPPGTQVGSPMTLTGRTARYPFQGSLAYRVLDLNGRELGAGTLPVTGAVGGPTSFRASLEFSPPAAGGRISVELVDQNPADGHIAASARLDLNVAAQPQMITIVSPEANQAVGSPMTVTGRTVRMPQGSQLSYRVRDQFGQLIGDGMFGVSSLADGGASFTAQVFFSLPSASGPISLELLELVAGSDQVRASTVLMLMVHLPPPTATPIPTATPTPTPSPTPTPRQRISITSPSADAQVSSPLTVSGQVALYPQFGELYYVIRTPSRTTLGQGSFALEGQPGQTELSYSATLSFSEPNEPGPIIIEIYDRDGVGQTIASAFVQVQGGP
ncbi:Gmad2 immunoglobulin-like domain-containing protein [Candidatus Viridilinea mediisalina]|uniref:Bacterial spore germination immunoglobulin-like domain-containing protein n=1 Tax=Candidatus Viridilinea mediisalina TaxID=2024553 RepID=A0A2A6RGC3_9CHLR|nr:Gmad2 immunoglobulin-like domain-containing protein [Candidatus Viridilinea mediisalina]PDW02117.1 hypothetical protein CJ255_15650 [Candidatus Viridilinea mediisalina]